jgi:hypothetical protein
MLEKLVAGRELLLCNPDLDNEISHKIAVRLGIIINFVEKHFATLNKNSPRNSLTACPPIPPAAPVIKT